MKKLIAVMAITLLAVATSIAQVVVSKVQDKSVAMRVKNGYSATLTIVVTGSGTNFTVACDANTNTVDGAGATDTIAELAAAFVACTNAAGTKSLVCDTDCALSADSTDGELLDGTYTAAPGKFLELLWDTSAALHYDVYLPGGVYGSGSYKLQKVTAYPGGTGNVTMGIYQGGVLIAQQVITSPVYVNAATYLTGGTNINTNTLGVVADVNIDWPLNIRSVGAQAILIRASRATTATSGVISAIIE